MHAAASKLRCPVAVYDGACSWRPRQTSQEDLMLFGFVVSRTPLGGLNVWMMCLVIVGRGFGTRPVMLFAGGEHGRDVEGFRVNP